MEKAYRFRIYPNLTQEKIIKSTFGCCRFVYNYYLNKRIEEYKNNKKTLGYYACCADLTKLKKEIDWLYLADATALQSSLQDLDVAYKNFFRKLKNNEVNVTYPKFKSKRCHAQSYRTKYSSVSANGIIVADKYIKLPKVGLVKCKVSKKVDGRILSATISQNQSGHYFVSFCCTDVNITPLPKIGSKCGVDLGVKTMATTSDGVTFQNNKYIHSSEKKLVKLQRELSRKTRGSKRYNQTRIKIAKLHEHIANQRKDTIQKTTTALIKSYDVICIENLNVIGMRKNHRLSKFVSDVAFGEFRRELEYKARWYDKIISVVNRFYPSSQLCSCCGYQNPITKDLKVREWVCPICGEKHDRDINAAKNILIEGLRLLS